MARKRYAIPQYGTVIMAGKEYYRTRIEDADGKRVALYGRTREELYVFSIQQKKAKSSVVIRLRRFLQKAEHQSRKRRH